MSVLPLSPSGILEFESCEKKFFHTKIAKTHKSQVTEAITYGNQVHQQLEMYVKKAEKLPTHLEHISPVIESLRSLGYTLYAELEMAIDANWKPIQFWDKSGYLRGKIDLVALKGDEAIVLDYKTGKRKNDPFQLKIYGAVLYHVLGLRKVESGYLWLKTKESDHFTIDGGNIALIQQEITERISKVLEAEKTNEWKARTSPLCGWCPVLSDCEFAEYYRNKKKY
jgi:ATP-dependent exoDNAse (exonuclease V) beta subunit